MNLPKADINSTTPSSQRHAVFHYFLSYDIKKDSATTTAHSKSLIGQLKEKNISPSLSKIWGQNDVCTEQYKCASVLYLMLVMSQCYSVTIY